MKTNLLPREKVPEGRMRARPKTTAAVHCTNKFPATTGASQGMKTGYVP